MDSVHNYPDAAQYLIPPRDNMGPFSEATHLLQIAEDLRHVDTPTEFVSNIYIASGNAWYYNGIKPQLDAALKANPGNAYQHLQQRRPDHQELRPAQSHRRRPLERAADSTSTRSQPVGSNSAQMLADPNIPKNTQTRHLSDLVAGLQHHYLGAQATAGSSAQKRDILKGAMADSSSNETAKQWPDVAIAISDLFDHLS